MMKRKICNLYNLHKNKINRFLQACPKVCSCFNFKKILFVRRTSFFASFREGSLTVEAALTVPIFLFAILNLFSLMEVFEIQMNLQAALHQTAKEMAVEGYAYNMIKKEKLTQSLPVQVVFSETYVRGKINQLVSKERLDASIVKNGTRGISYSFSKIMEKDRIELVAVYGITPRFTMIPFSDLYTFTQAKVRAFTGYDPSLEGKGGREEETYVYVTETGTAYHMDRGCSYLKLSISLIRREELAGARNEDGGKYKSCKYCNYKRSEGNLFLITNQGNRFHTTVTCKGLKRTVKSIPLKNATKYHSCSRCGK